MTKWPTHRASLRVEYNVNWELPGLMLMTNSNPKSLWVWKDRKWKTQTLSSVSVMVNSGTARQSGTAGEVFKLLDENGRVQNIKRQGRKQTVRKRKKKDIEW